MVHVAVLVDLQSRHDLVKVLHMQLECNITSESTSSLSARPQISCQPAGFHYIPHREAW